MYLRYILFSGGLHPSETLYPSDSLYPSPDANPVPTRTQDALSNAQGAITNIELGGPASIDYITVLNGAETPELMAAAYIDGTYTPTYGENTLLQADFTDELQGGNLGQTEGSLVGLAIYRQQNGNRVLQHLIDLPLDTSQLYDYGAASQQRR